MSPGPTFGEPLGCEHAPERCDECKREDKAVNTKTRLMGNKIDSLVSKIETIEAKKKHADGIDPDKCPDCAKPSPQIDWPDPVHWFIEPRRCRPRRFCVTNQVDAAAAEWHEKEHGHKVTPLYDKDAMWTVHQLGVQRGMKFAGIGIGIATELIIEIDEDGKVSGPKIEGPIREDG